MLPACCSNLSSSTWQLRSEDPWTTCFSAPERLRKNVLYGIEEGLARHRVRLIKLASVWGVNSLPRKPASNNRFRSSRLASAASNALMASRTGQPDAHPGHRG